MKCSDLQNSLALYTDDALTEGESLSIKGHLELCPLCRERYSEYREIVYGLSRLARPNTSPTLRENLKHGVVSEVRAHRRSWLPLAPDVREFLQMRVMPYGVGSFASLLLLGTFLTMMFSGLFKNNSLPAERSSPMRAANYNPFRGDGDISTTDFVQSRFGLAGESPSINPQGALVALTKAFVQDGMRNDEVVVVAEVYSDGLAQIAEVVEPSRNKQAVGQLEKALYSSLAHAPFVPSSMEERPESMQVVLKFQTVDVHANTKRKTRWQ